MDLRRAVDHLFRANLAIAIADIWTVSYNYCITQCLTLPVYASTPASTRSLRSRRKCGSEIRRIATIRVLRMATQKEHADSPIVSE